MVAPLDGTYANVARVSSSASDPDGANNRSTTSTAVAMAHTSPIGTRREAPLAADP